MIWAPHAEALQAEALQAGALQDGVLQAGALQAGAPQVGALQARALKTAALRVNFLIEKHKHKYKITYGSYFNEKVGGICSCFYLVDNLFHRFVL